MPPNLQLMDSPAGFWLLVYAVSLTIIALFVIAALLLRLRRGKCITWELHSEYIDVSEFSNRNIPLRVMYKGSEPAWLWATYLSLRNTGSGQITGSDLPEKKQFIVGAPGCRYIGFNKLISDKARVVFSPLFKGEDVFCRVEFDKLGPGDEILASLLFIAESRQRVKVSGGLFGDHSRILSGFNQRMQSIRALWWLLITIIIAGSISGYLYWMQSVTHRDAVQYQLQILGVIYFLALITAAILLRPVRYWEQIPSKFHETESPGRKTIVDYVKFLFGIGEFD